MHPNRLVHAQLSILSLCAALLAAPAGGAPETAPALLPIEDFSKPAQYVDMQMSPDGATLAFLTFHDESTGLGFFSLGKMKAETMLWGEKGASVASKNNAVFGYTWVSPERVVAFTALGWAATNRDFSDFRYLTGWGRITEQAGQPGIGSVSGFEPLSIIADARQDPRSILVMNVPDVSNMEVRPDVLQLNTLDGSFHVVERNPGNVRSWGADWDGNIRFGLISDQINTELIFRPSPGAPWGAPIEFGRATLASSLAGLDGDDRTLFVFKSSPEGRRTLYSFDLKEGRFSEPLFAHKKYDVFEAVFSPKHRRLLGVRYTTEIPRAFWFEPTLARLQEGLDKAGPGSVHEIVSFDWEIKKVLVHTHSAREPGSYTVVDLDSGKVLPVAQTRPWINPLAMAEMYPVKCRARDGLELNGYLSLPVGRGKKGLPMVTLVHGGPFGVRDTWQYDPLVQFLANRGYAVLQVNYRGSWGYGDEFYLKGLHEVGGAIQDDIEDMTRWAVAQGIADPRRLAIMGGSYGGYSTLFALAHTPDLFRCGIAFAAVSDWGALMRSVDDKALNASEILRYWAAVLGDMKDEKQRQRLAAVSPVTMAASIKAPVFIVHGEIDGTVPIDQAYEMVSALKKAGNAPETLYIDKLGHWWPTEKRGALFLGRLEAFLQAHLAK